MLKDPNRSSRPPTTACFRSATATSTVTISWASSADHNLPLAAVTSATAAPGLMTSRQVRRRSISPTNYISRRLFTRDNGGITTTVKHAIKLTIKLKTSTGPARLAQLLQPSLAFCCKLQPMTAYRTCASLAGLVLCFIAAACCSCNDFKFYPKFYCMFYCSCDRSITNHIRIESRLTVSANSSTVNYRPVA